MTSNQPYLLRAFYEWIVDNDLTPYLVVDATIQGTQVPQEHVRDGQIVLNVSPNACVKMNMDNVDVSFEARFGGVPRQLIFPCHAVLAIYAKENGAGTVFTPEEAFGGAEDAPLNATSNDRPVSPLEAPTEATSKSNNENAPKPAKKGPPTLKVIK